MGSLSLTRPFPKKQEVLFSHLRILGIHAPTRSLSQLVTTFIGTRAERSPSWVVASHVCIPHHASNPSVSKHANSASTENHLPEGDSPQPFPRHDRHDRVLSNHPTFPPYKKKSVQDEPATAEQSCVLAVFQRLRKFTSFWGKVAQNSPSQPNLRSPCRAFRLPGSTDRD